MQTSSILKFGSNGDVDTVDETVWDGGAIYAYQSTAVAVEAISTEAADNPLGTGAATIDVQGLDADYNMVSDTITMAGDSASAESTVTFLRVFRARVLTAGSGGVNAGAITVRVTGAGADVAVIQAGNGQTLMALWTVPAGSLAEVTRWYGNVAKGKDATFKLFTRAYNAAGNGAWQLKGQLSSYQGEFERQYSPFMAVTSKTDIEIRCVSENVNTPVNAGFDARLTIP